jgi:hypothetical protein
MKTTEEAIQFLKDEYDLISDYILNDLQPYDFNHLGYVKQIEPFGNHYKIAGSDDLTLFEAQDIEHEQEYKYSVLVGVEWNSNSKNKALIKLKSNLFWLIEFK